MKNFQKDMCGPGERLSKIQPTTRPDHLWLEIWSDMSKAAHKKEKKEWAIEEPTIDNAQRLRVIYVIDLEDESTKKPYKNERKS